LSRSRHFSGFVPTCRVRSTALKLAYGALLAVAAGFGAMALARAEAAGIRQLVPVAVVAGVMVLVLALDTSWMALPVGTSEGIFKCLVSIPVLATLPLAAFLLVLRNGAVVRPGVAGALAGVASAGIATLAYGLHCNQDSPLFIAMWYSSAAAIVAAIGAWAGRRTLVW
jgi:hypothetical protein